MPNSQAALRRCNHQQARNAQPCAIIMGSCKSCSTVHPSLVPPSSCGFRHVSGCHALVSSALSWCCSAAGLIIFALTATRNPERVIQPNGHKHISFISVQMHPIYPSLVPCLGSADAMPCHAEPNCAAATLAGWHCLPIIPSLSLHHLTEPAPQAAPLQRSAAPAAARSRRAGCCCWPLGWASACPSHSPSHSCT